MFNGKLFTFSFATERYGNVIINSSELNWMRCDKFSAMEIAYSILGGENSICFRLLSTAEE